MLNSRDVNALRADVANACNEVIRLAKLQGITLLITSTVRDDEYQNVLYQQGRTTPGGIVTNAQKPSFHWEKTGLAFDFCPIKIINGKNICLWGDIAKFKAVGKIAIGLGLEWGGSWKSFMDMPHVQWSDGGKYTANMVRSLNLPKPWVNPNAKPAVTQTINKGDLVRIKPTATQWAKTVIFIPSWAKTKTYRVAQIQGDKALLAQINSWVYLRDIER